jgi:hypothetical protein
VSSREDKKAQLNFSISEDLKIAIENDYKQRGFDNATDFYRKALEHFLNCKEDEKSQAMRLLVTKYDGFCLKCRHEIPKGSWALYGKGVGLICLDCYIQRIGDKTLIAKYLKNRELTQITKALQDEADRLAEKVEAYRGIEKLDSLTTQEEKLHKIALEYLQTKLGTPQEKETFEEILRENEVIKHLIRDIEEFIAKYIQIRKRKKKLTETEREESAQ